MYTVTHHESNMYIKVQVFSPATLALVCVQKYTHSSSKYKRVWACFAVCKIKKPTTTATTKSYIFLNCRVGLTALYYVTCVLF